MKQHVTQLNAEWVPERGINSPSIWLALPPQPQEAPLPPLGGGERLCPHDGPTSP